MENRSTLQDKFLNEIRGKHMPVTFFLTNGFQQRGVVQSFDGFTVLLYHEGKQYLIYKHAISTIVPMERVEMREE
ncbi:RNA chaperone Hfq [Acidaminobacterium chupaoyuni]